MLFTNIIGQEVAKQILRRSFEEKRLAQSYLFYGPAGVGKEMAAFELAQALNCTGEEPPCGSCSQCRKTVEFNHPDLHYVFPVPHPSSESDKRKLSEEIAELLAQKAQKPYLNLEFDRPVAISIDDIRVLQSKLSLQPYQGRKKVVIIVSPEALTTEAANAFLKTLEEPSPTTNFILVCDQSNALLSTILSRCQKIRFMRLDKGSVVQALEERHGLPPDQAQMLASLSQGSLGQALEMMELDLLEERRMAGELLRAGLEKNYVGMMESIDLAAGEKGRPQRVLDMMSAIVLEALHPEPQPSPEVLSLARLLTEARLNRITANRELARTALMRNVTPRLCLMAACSPDIIKEEL
ncbi:DNA polymerase III subunit delta' [candidate division TA06 bacterium]|uniref:DNA polymerase III subunit delta n=1 Tax=candidate division TA06 bacterium TaxID=2250710 RepID=A0A933MJW1_UNCT6|nr:DNA polymerase III subunit delta' [candidate division TA06 bacterium]